MSRIRSDGVAVYVYRQGTDGLELLQLRRVESRPGYGAGTWQIVYGGIEAGETAPEAAFRELEEETGLCPPELTILEHVESFYFRPMDSVLALPVFAVEVATDAAVRLNHEHDAFRWVPLAAVPHEFVWRSQRQSIEVLMDQLASAHPHAREALRVRRR